MLDNIRIVLIGTTHSGNIGAAARAMKVMRLSQLVLVAPKEFPNPEATALASSAADLLEQARVCANLEEAIAGCRLVVGTSARLRSVQWPQMEPRECAARLVEEGAAGPVALLFGRERTGLTNEELDRCHALVNIPANPEYSSLNLAQAVQVLSYEIQLAWLATQAWPQAPQPEVATAEQLEGFFDHLRTTMEEIGFADPNRSDRLQRRLRRLFLRARPDPIEINILRGILSAAQGRKTRRPSTADSEGG